MITIEDRGNYVVAKLSATKATKKELAYTIYRRGDLTAAHADTAHTALEDMQKRIADEIVRLYDLEDFLRVSIKQMEAKNG